MYDKYQTDRAGPDRPKSRGRTRARPHDDRAAPDRMYNRCRVHDPIFVTSGPPLPEHMLAHTCKVAVNMQAGRYERRPTFVLGMRAGDASTQKLATRIVRGHVEPLRDDSATLLQYWTGNRAETCKALSIFQVVQDSFALERGRPWTLWAFRHMWDQRPQAMTSVSDVLVFLERRLKELEAGDTQAAPMLPPGMKLPSDFGYEDSWLIMHFVVEVSPTWPKLFEVTCGNDEEEARIQIEVEKRKLEWKEKAEREAMKATQKRMEERGKEVEKKSVEKKEGRNKEMEKKESVAKEREKGREHKKKEAEKKEAERKDREKGKEREQGEREKTEERDRKEKEKEKERERARERRREREEQERREREQDRREELERREKERERRRERGLREEEERHARRERERQKDRLRERTTEKKVLIRSHGQVSIGTTTSSTVPSLRAFLRGQATR